MQNDILTAPEAEIDYYAIDRMSNSAMTHFRKSPRHYLYNKNTPQEPTPAMIFGNAFHTYILENDKFNERYCCVPANAPDRPTSAMRTAKNPSEASVVRVAWWNKFESESENKIVLSAEEIEMIKHMQDALYKHEPAMELLNEIKSVEVSLFWSDDITGVEMKGKVDGKGTGFKIDLKTCADANPETFTRHAFDYSMHRQAALYEDGGKAKFGSEDFYFIACEKTPPYCISVFKCSEEFIRYGRAEYGSILENYAYWKQLGSPDIGYNFLSPFGVFNLGLPRWLNK